MVEYFFLNIGMNTSLHLMNISLKRQTNPGDFCVFSLLIDSFVSSSLNSHQVPRK